MDRLGLLQFDPLEVPGARSHDLTLHARVGGYRRAWCDRWLYGPPGGDVTDRRLIELYNKSLNILPLAELPHYAITWDRSHDEYRNQILREQAAVADAILERIRTDGPLSTAAFREHGHAVDWWWGDTSAARAVAEALFVTGRLGIARRDGSRRYYDLIERLVRACAPRASRIARRRSSPSAPQPLPRRGDARRGAAGRDRGRDRQGAGAGPAPGGPGGGRHAGRGQRSRDCAIRATSWPTSCRSCGAASSDRAGASPR